MRFQKETAVTPQDVIPTKAPQPSQIGLCQIRIHTPKMVGFLVGFLCQDEQGASQKHTPTMLPPGSQPSPFSVEWLGFRI